MLCRGNNIRTVHKDLIKYQTRECKRTKGRSRQSDIQEKMDLVNRHKWTEGWKYNSTLRRNENNNEEFSLILSVYSMIHHDN